MQSICSCIIYAFVMYYTSVLICVLMLIYFCGSYYLHTLVVHVHMYMYIILTFIILCVNIKVYLLESLCVNIFLGH